MNNLYEIAADYRDVAAMLADDEVDTQAVMDTLESIQGEFEDKADNLACIVKELEAAAGAIKAEADRLSERAAGKSAKAKRLRAYLCQQMELSGIKRVETARNQLSLRGTAGSLKFRDEGAFMRWAMDGHKEFLRERDPEIDKKAVRDALKSGQELPGASVEKGTALTLK